MNRAIAAADSIATDAHSAFADGSRYFSGGTSGSEMPLRGARRGRRPYILQAAAWILHSRWNMVVQIDGNELLEFFSGNLHGAAKRGAYARFSSSARRNSLARESLLLTVPTLICNSAEISS